MNKIYNNKDGNPYIDQCTTRVPIETCNFIDLEISMICNILEELRYCYNSINIKIDDILKEYRKCYTDLIDKKIDLIEYNKKIHSIGRCLWNRFNCEE